MKDEQIYDLQVLGEFIRQGESQQRERCEAWAVSVGLQQVDALLSLGYLLDTAHKTSRVTSL